MEAIWGYLQEFWNAITSVGGYTIEFFQNIGNAVAGAVGSLFNFLIHSITDVFIFIGWTFNNFANFFGSFMLPVRYVYTFLKQFVDVAFSTPTTSAKSIWFFSADILSVFDKIPYWNIFSSVIGVALIVLLGFGVLRLFRHI